MKDQMTGFDKLANKDQNIAILLSQIGLMMIDKLHLTRGRAMSNRACFVKMQVIKIQHLPHSVRRTVALDCRNVPDKKRDYKSVGPRCCNVRTQIAKLIAISCEQTGASTE
jgi:hypothetical protein